MSITDKLEGVANKINHVTETLKYIEQVASGKSSYDYEDFNVFDASGGNYDDAYSLGCEDGEIMFARIILAKLKGDKQ